MNEVIRQIGEIGIIPVVVIDDAQSAADLGRALLAGGLPCAEITFRTAAAEESIRLMTRACPDILVGAGTVLTVEQAEQAQAAGARFIVTPGFDASIVDWCLNYNQPIMPGVMTPTDINLALAKGLNVLKFFPAEIAGGVKALQAIGGPYGGVKFVPTGGITADNLADYLALPMVHACGGSFMVSPKLIAAGQFDRITQLARSAVDIVASVRASQTAAAQQVKSP